MKNTKKIVSATLALLMALTITGCGSSNDSSESSEYKDKVEVPTTDAVEAIPDGAEKELDYVTFDTNFLAGNAETPANIDLFQKKGGKINVIRVSNSLELHNKLATLVISDNVPDVTTPGAFPSDIILGFFQPVDEIVNLDDAMWKDQKALAQNFILNGKNYIAPMGYTAASVLTYDQNVIDAEGLDDPYNTWTEGNWDWDAFYDVMKGYVSNAKGDEERYGINGFYQRFLYYSTGKTIVNYDSKTNEYTNNIQDPDLAKAADFMYKIRKEGLQLDGWIGSASGAFDASCLFYAMGQWASTNNNGPSEGDNWMTVPMPNMPGAEKNYMAADVSTAGSLMWIKGSAKKEAMKCLFECTKVISLDETLSEANYKKFKANNPYYSEAAYKVITEDIYDEQYIPLIDPSYGLTDALSSDSAQTNAEKMPIMTQCYNLSNGEGDNKVFSWAQIISRNSNTIDSELKEFNTKLKTFVANDK